MIEAFVLSIGVYVLAEILSVFNCLHTTITEIEKKGDTKFVDTIDKWFDETMDEIDDIMKSLKKEE